MKIVQRGLIVLFGSDFSKKAQCVFNWLERVIREGAKTKKTLMQMRTKNLDGFPQSFDVITAPERLSTANGGAGSYVHAANYPNHYPAALAGQANPDAGQPDLQAMAMSSMSFYTTWIAMCQQGKIEAPPEGFNFESDDEDFTKSKTEDSATVSDADGTWM